MNLKTKWTLPQLPMFSCTRTLLLEDRDLQRGMGCKTPPCINCMLLKAEPPGKKWWWNFTYFWAASDFREDTVPIQMQECLKRFKSSCDASDQRHWEFSFLKSKLLSKAYNKALWKVNLKASNNKAPVIDLGAALNWVEVGMCEIHNDK